MVLETAPPTTPPPDENCTGAPAIAPNTTLVVDLSDHVDDLQLGCSVGTPDAAYALTLDAPSDVLLIQTVSDGDQGWVSLAEPACAPGTRSSVVRLERFLAGSRRCTVSLRAAIASSTKPISESRPR